MPAAVNTASLDGQKSGATTPTLQKAGLIGTLAHGDTHHQGGQQARSTRFRLARLLINHHDGRETRSCRHLQGGRLSELIITPQPGGLALAAAALKGDVMLDVPPGHHMLLRCAMTGGAARDCRQHQQHNMSQGLGYQ